MFVLCMRITDYASDSMSVNSHQHHSYVTYRLIYYTSHWNYIKQLTIVNIVLLTLEAVMFHS